MDRHDARGSGPRRPPEPPLVIFGWTTSWEELWTGVVRYMLLPFVQGVMLGLGHYGTRYALARLLPPLRPARVAVEAEPPTVPAPPAAPPALLAASGEVLA